MEKFSRYDTADYLDSEESILAYLEASIDDDDPAQIVAALGNVARARNISKLSRDSGVTREGIYKAFSGEGNPSFATVFKVLRALGYGFAIRSLPDLSDLPDLTATPDTRPARAA